MSTKRSDLAAPEAPPATPSPGRVSLLRANWMLPVALLLLWPLAYLVQDSGLVDRYSLRLIILVGINITLAVSLQLINGISGQFSLGHAGFMAVGAYLAAYPAKTFAPELQHPFAVLLFYVALGLVVAVAGGLLLGLFILIRASRRWHSSLPPILMVAVLAWMVVDVASSAEMTGTPPPYLIWSGTIHVLQTLYSAMLTHGQSMAVAAGSWLASWLPGWLLHALTPAWFLQVLTFVILLLGGGTCAAVAGLIIGIPTLRLRGDYLAIATLGFAEIIGIVITNSEPLGGALGMSRIPQYGGFAWVYGVALITVVAIWRLVHSARGRALLAVREDEIAAAAVGIDPTRSKVMAFVVGAFFAGMAGTLFAHTEGFITPRHFAFMRSIELVVMVTLAGSGSITGTILAAVVLTYLPEELRSFSEWRMVIYSVLLIVMMLLRPEGLLGSRELWWRRRNHR